MHREGFPSSAPEINAFMFVFNDQKDMAEKIHVAGEGKMFCDSQVCDGEMRIQHREGDASVSSSTAPQSECTIWLNPCCNGLLLCRIFI